jgi:excisionase family DNA binding protein
MASNAEELELFDAAKLEPLVPRTLLLKPEDAAKYLNVGRQKMYSMLASGEIVSIKMSRKILVPVKALNEWVDERMAESRDAHA